MVEERSPSITLSRTSLDVQRPGRIAVALAQDNSVSATVQAQRGGVRQRDVLRWDRNRYGCNSRRQQQFLHHFASRDRFIVAHTIKQ